MLKETALVIDYQNGIATVKCHSKSACGSCSAKDACGTSVLSELAGSQGEHIFQIATITPLKIGQRVEIGLSENSLLSAALLLYSLPLLVLLVSTLLSQSLFEHELLRALFIFAATALSFLLLRKRARKMQHKAAYQPVLLRLL